MLKLLLVAGLACTGLSFARGQQESSVEKPLPAVPSALSALKMMNVPPRMDAKYYIYVRSAGWCSWCKIVTPDLVSGYSKMREKGVELVMIYGAKSEEVALEHIKKMNIGFPVVWNGSGQGEQIAALPGIKQMPGALPACLIVTADGEVLCSSTGVGLRDWEAVLVGPFTKANMKEKLALLKPLGSKEICDKAKFYVNVWGVYMPDEAKVDAYMQEMEEAYNEIRSRKGELVFYITNFCAKAKEKYENGSYSYPAVFLKHSEGRYGVPGLVFATNNVVDAKGKMLTFTNKKELPDWREAVKQMEEAAAKKKDSVRSPHYKTSSFNG